MATCWSVESLSSAGLWKMSPCCVVGSTDNLAVSQPRRLNVITVNTSQYVRLKSARAQSRMYYTIWMSDPKMAHIQSNRIARLAHTPKKFLASGFTSGVCGPLNMHSSVTPIMPLAQPAYENVWSHSGDIIQNNMTFLGLGKVLQRLNLHGLKIYNIRSNNWPYSWRFTDVSFTVVVDGENAFWTPGGLFVATLQVATGKHWKQDRAAALYPVLEIHSWAQSTNPEGGHLNSAIGSRIQPRRTSPASPLFIQRGGTGAEHSSLARKSCMQAGSH